MLTLPVAWLLPFSSFTSPIRFFSNSDSSFASACCKRITAAFPENLEGRSNVAISCLTRSRALFSPRIIKRLARSSATTRIRPATPLALFLPLPPSLTFSGSKLVRISTISPTQASSNCTTSNSDTPEPSKRSIIFSKRRTLDA